MHRSHVPVMLAAAAFAVLLTGCATGAATQTTSASPAGSPTATPAASTDPNAPANQCPDDALEVTIDGGDAGAGSISYDLVFTNTGANACELRGAPGVSVIDASGSELGVPAEQTDDEAPSTLTLEPGGSVVAALRAVNIDPDGGPLDNCPVVHGSGYRVYPPHSFAGFIVDAAGVPACDSSTVFMAVGPVKTATA